MIKRLICLWGKSLTEETKNKLWEILSPEVPEDLYKPQTIKSIEKFIEGCNKYWWVDYKKT